MVTLMIIVCLAHKATKKQLKEKVKNECQKQETGPRKKRGMNEFEMDKKKGEAFRLEHAGLFGGKFD